MIAPIHDDPSPSHAEGAWCNSVHNGVHCGQFVPLHHFRGGDERWAKPYLEDTRGVELVRSGDMTTLVHFAHAWAVQNPDKVDAEEAELVERYMRAEHGQE